MQVLCTRENLLYGVQVVQRAVSSKTTMPVLSGILLRTANNRLLLTATDLELGINVSVPVQVMEEGSTVIQSKFFSELVRRLPDTPIEISMEPGTKSVTINYSPSKTSINSMDPEEFPVVPELENSSCISLNSSTFKSMVKQTTFATAPDENRPIFTGVLLLVDQREIKMVATDTHRLAFRTGVVESPLDEPWQAIIPGKTLNEVSKLIKEEDEIITIVPTNNQVMFKFGEISLISRLIDGQFPNHTQVIPKSCKTKVRVGTKALLDSVERASLLAREGSNVIKLVIQDNTLVITSNSPDLGKAHEELSIEIDGEETQIAFNSRYLIDALKAIDSEEIMLELSGSLSPGVIRPMETNNYLYLILPVRTN